MSFKQKLEIHDAMMALHEQFMESAREVKANQPADLQGKIDILENLMKSICQLVDKALDVESV